MNLIKIRDDLYVPEDFVADHNYYADPEGKKRYSGITTILNVLAKPALIPWAANMATQYVSAGVEEMIKECSKDEPTEEVLVLTDDTEIQRLRQLIKDAAGAHTRKKEEAGAHGTDAHALVEAYVNRRINAQKLLKDKKASKEAIAYFEGLIGVETTIAQFATWADENVDHFLFSERRLANAELFVAGTADFAYVGKDGRRYMADFKTSSGIYGIGYWLQVAAYRMIAEAEGDKAYDGMAIIRLGKDGKFEAQYLYDFDTYRDAFLACLTLYRAQNAIKGMVIK